MNGTLRRSQVALGILVALLAGACLLAGAATGSANAEADLSIDDVLPDLVQADESLEVSYTAPAEELTLRAIGPDGEVAFEYDIDHPGGAGEVTVPAETLQKLRPGDHDLELEVDATGETVSMSNAFERGTAVDPDQGSFADVTFDGVAGDFVQVDVSLDDVDEAYILFGGDRPADEPGVVDAPVDVLHVDGSSTFLINTRLIGTDRPSEAVYIPVDGSVTSYAHELGPASEPAGVFADLRFEDTAGDDVAETLAEFREATSSGTQARPLQPGRYSLVVGEGDAIVLRDDGISDPLFPFDRANIELTEPTVGEVTTYYVPKGNADQVGHHPDPDELEELGPDDIGTILGQATETDEITVGDRLLVEVEATGIWGAMADTVYPAAITDEQNDLLTPAAFGNLVDVPEGIELNVTQTNVQRNEPVVEFELFDSDTSDVSYFTDPVLGADPLELDRFYVLVDTRAPGGVSQPLQGGEAFDVNFAITGGDDRYRFSSVTNQYKPHPYNPDGDEQFPYFEGSEVRTSSFSVIERTFEYENTDRDENPVVANESGQTIAGNSTFPEGAEPIDIVVDQRFPPVTVEIENVDIADDGSFSIQTDLSEMAVGGDVDIQFWAYEELLDERSLTVLDSADDFARFEVTEIQTSSELVGEEPAANIEAEVTNVGDLDGEHSVSLYVDGEHREEQTVHLDRDESTVIEFETADELEPGAHPLTVQTLHDDVSQLFVVEEPEPFFAVESLTTETTVENDTREQTVTATVVNAGMVGDEADIEFELDNESLTNETVVLDSGENQTITVDDALADLDPGTYELSVHTPDDTERTELVIEPEPARFAVTDFEVESPIEVGDTVTGSVTIANTGEESATDDIQIRLANETILTDTVELTSDETTTVTFDDERVDEPGEYNVTVETADDSAQTSLVVEERPTDDEPTDDVDDEPPEEAPDDEGIFGLALGARPAVGGTAVVAAAYVLGYWV